MVQIAVRSRHCGADNHIIGLTARREFAVGIINHKFKKGWNLIFIALDYMYDFYNFV